MLTPLRTITFFLAGSSLLLAQAPPQDPMEAELLALLNTPVESASKRMQKAIESPQAVEVITADQIKASGAFRLADVLRLATSVQVWDEDGDRCNVTIRGVSPGGNPRTVQILVDGVALFNIVASPLDLNGIPVPTDAIERVEIVRGPSSSLYGANAQTGVIAITTKRAAQGLAGSVRLGAADHGAFREEAFVSYGAGNFAITAGGAGFSNRNENMPLSVVNNPAGSIPFNDASHGAQAFIRPEATLGEAGKIWLSYGHGDAGHNDQLSVNPASLAPLATFPNMAVDRETLQVGWAKTWSPTFKTDLRFNQKTFSLSINPIGTVAGSPSSPIVVGLLEKVDPALAGAHDFYHDQVQTAQLQANWDPSRTFHLVAGLDSSKIATGANLTIGLPTAQTFSATGGFLSLDWQVDQVTVSAGARVANESLGGSSTSPRVSVVWSLNDSTVLRAGYFTSTRSPTAQEKYQSVIGNPVVGYNLLPNPQIQPEQADDYEVGLRKSWEKWSLDVTYFHTTLKKLLVTAPTGQITGGKADDSTANDPSNYSDSGFELALTGELAHGLLVGLNASTASFKDPIYGLDQQADYSPQSQGTAWARYRHGLFFGYLAIQHTGAYTIASPQGAVVQRQTLDSSNQGHFNFGLEPVKNLSVSVYGINAFRAAQEVSNISLVSANGIRYTRRELGLQATYRF